MPQQRKKAKRMFIRLMLKGGKNISFNTGASLVFLGYQEADVYEKGDVVAIQAVHGGAYHLANETGRDRKSLSSLALAKYLCQKFGCKEGERLDAWTNVQEGVLFFSGVRSEGKRNCLLDETYTKLVFEYNCRAGDWAYIHDNWVDFSKELRENLPEHMRAYRCGDAVVLLEDEKGPLHITTRRQTETRLIVSYALTLYLGGVFQGERKGFRLKAKQLANGVILAATQEALEQVRLEERKEILLDETQRRTLKMDASRKGIYLSVPAWKFLNEAERVSVYRCKGFLALKPEKDGTIKVNQYGYQRILCSVALLQMMAERWPETVQLYLHKHEEFFLLWPEIKPPQGVPAPTSFRRLAVPSLRPSAEQKSVAAGIRAVAPVKVAAEPLERTQRRLYP